MSKIRDYWLGLSIVIKMRLFIVPLLLVITVAAGFNMYTTRFSVNGGRSCAKALNHSGHDRVIGDTDLHVLHVSRRCDGLVSNCEEVTEAFLAEVQALNAKAQLFRLIQEFLAELAVCEVPVVVSVSECVRQGKKNGLLCAIGCKSLKVPHSW